MEEVVKVKDIGGEEITVLDYVNRLAYRQSHSTVSEDLPPDPFMNLVVCLAGHGLVCGQRIPARVCCYEMQGKTKTWTCKSSWRWHIKAGVLYDVRMQGRAVWRRVTKAPKPGSRVPLGPGNGRMVVVDGRLVRRRGPF